jgi:hypothetical protein
MAAQQSTPVTGPTTLILERRQLTVARWALMDRLHEYLGVVREHVGVALTNADAGVQIEDARNWSRQIRDTLDALDGVGWPVGDPELTSARPDDEVK